MTLRFRAGVFTAVIVLSAMRFAAAAAPSDFGYQLSRVKTGGLGGTTTMNVIVSGANARMTFVASTDPVRNQQAVELWLADGHEDLVIDPEHRAYFDAQRVAQARTATTAPATLGTLRGPAIATATATLSNLHLDLQGDPVVTTMSGIACSRSTLSMSYQLAIAVAGTHIPAEVKAVAEFCITEKLSVAKLPFGHGTVSFTTGFVDADAAIAAQLATLHGIAVFKKIEATRQLQDSPITSETLTETVSEMHSTSAPANAFDRPVGFAYQEPVLVGPLRIGRGGWLK